MSEPEEPLHVRVARALGCKVYAENDAFTGKPFHYSCDCRDSPHGEPHPEIMVRTIARYDTDWAATGPLIEKWRFHADVRFDPACHAPEWDVFYIPKDDGDIIEAGPAPTMLQGACRLILALHTAGKLPK